MIKQTLTIEELLGRYYYKEWIQDDLREIGESANGSKDELIKRYLNSNKIRDNSVKDIASGLVSSLRKHDLRQILRDHAIRNGNTKEELLRKVLESFSFEPYLTILDRNCDTCGIITEQELHFDNSWKADHFKCLTCNSNLPLSRNSDARTCNEIKVIYNTSDAIKFLKTHYWQVISVFIAITVGLGVKYGWSTGFGISIITTAIISFWAFLISKHRDAR
ncbi:MAG: hypothetical protein ACYCSG_03015 [Thermoplasmataceae archaeon]